MTTPRDLLIVTMDAEPGPPVEEGDLSLALAGAEAVDLLAAGAAGLDGDRLVPGPAAATGDRLLDEAASLLVAEAPYESVEDWLWRRGRDLSSAYRAELREAGQTTTERPRRRPWATGRPVLVESPARREAVGRWRSGEPVLVALASAAGVPVAPEARTAGVDDDAVATVLAAVNDAVEELQTVRQRRSIEKAAFDNIWRA